MKLKNDVVIVTFFDNFGDVVSRKGYFVDTPAMGEDGNPAFQWTLSDVASGFFFWVESGGQILIQDVVVTNQKAVRIGVETVRTDYEQIKSTASRV